MGHSSVPQEREVFLRIQEHYGFSLHHLSQQIPQRQHQKLRGLTLNLILL